MSLRVDIVSAPLGPTSTLPSTEVAANVAGREVDGSMEEGGVDGSTRGSTSPKVF